MKKTIVEKETCYRVVTFFENHEVNIWDLAGPVKETRSPITYEKLTKEEIELRLHDFYESDSILEIRISKI